MSKIGCTEGVKDTECSWHGVHTNSPETRGSPLPAIPVRRLGSKAKVRSVASCSHTIFWRALDVTRLISSVVI
jgi:hypothetical protein